MPHLDKLRKILDREDVWGNNVLDWLMALLAAAGVAIVLEVTKTLLIRYANRSAERGDRNWARAIATVVRCTKGWFLLAVALYSGIYVLLLQADSKPVPTVINWIGAIALWSQAALWTNALIRFSGARYAEKNRDVDAGSVTMLSTLGSIGRAGVWVLAALMVPVSMGKEITPLIAGLGIGGIAVALAIQSILGDLFASVSIVLDKPFVIGDFLIVDDKMGSVEHVGLKTTHLRSLSGEQLVFSNTDLLKSRIHNYKRMHERRALFTIDVAYDTPYEKVAAIPAMLREAVEAQKPVRFDRAHFARYGESALIFEVVYYVLAPEYGVFMDVQQAINLVLFRRFAEENIEFAFPTRTVYLQQPSGAEMA